MLEVFKLKKIEDLSLSQCKCKWEPIEEEIPNEEAILEAKLGVKKIQTLRIWDSAEEMISPGRFFGFTQNYSELRRLLIKDAHELSDLTTDCPTSFSNNNLKILSILGSDNLEEKDIKIILEKLLGLEEFTLRSNLKGKSFDAKTFFSDVSHEKLKKFNFYNNSPNTPIQFMEQLETIIKSFPNIHFLKTKTRSLCEFSDIPDNTHKTTDLPNEIYHHRILWKK